MEKRLAEALAYFRARPVYQKLFKKVWTKVEGLGHFGGSVTLAGLKSDEKEALEGFFQRSFRGKESITISAVVMEKALANSRFAGLEWTEILEAYFGNGLIGAKFRKEQEEQRQCAFFQQYTEKGGSEREEAFRAWLAMTLAQRRTGWQMLEKQYRENSAVLSEVLNALLRAAEQLPIYEQAYLPLPVFAARVTGNPHFFDEGRLAGRLLLLFLADLFSIEGEAVCAASSGKASAFETAGKDLRKESDMGPEWKNRTLYQAGILKDGLSNHTLLYGIRALCKDGLLHPGFEGFYQRREPMQCTLQTLGGLARAWGNPKVYVVENPAVFSALLDTYPEASLVCTNGQPRLASLVLLDLLVKESLLYYAGDFDPEGLSIAQNLKRRYGDSLEYWGYSKENYNRTVSSVTLEEKRLKKLDAIKDETLLVVADCMREKKRAAYQEAMLAFGYQIEVGASFSG